MGYAAGLGLETYKISTTLKNSKDRGKTLLSHGHSLCQLSGDFHALLVGLGWLLFNTNEG